MLRQIALSVILTVPVVPLAAVAAQAAPAATDLIGGVRENAPPEVKKAVLAAVDAWKRAVIQKDAPALQRILDEDLSYGHTTGEVLGKAQTIERALDPKQRFSAIDLTDVAVRSYGNFALVTHRISFHFVKDGAPGAADLSGIDVWIRKDHGWRLLARQLTRLPQ
ncbi:MAG TPA: nuclear transport factor 2 family protein [Steroidobacteraceae bacterium]|nr:nuclear transport factor 2 family protein [Steroidobacteraceae bacterium]